MSDLSTADWADLHQLVTSRGYEILQRLWQDEEEQLTLELVNADPAKRDNIWAAQAVLHGFHVGINNVNNRIAIELEHYKAWLNPRVQSAEDKFVEETLSPFGLEQ